MIELNLNKKEDDILEHGDILISNDKETITILTKVDNGKYHLIVLNDVLITSLETFHSESMPLESIKKSFKLLKKHNEYKMTIDEL